MHSRLVQELLEMRLKTTGSLLICGSLVFAAGSGLATLLLNKRVKELDAQFRYECPMHLSDLGAILSEHHSRTGAWPSNLLFVATAFKPRPAYKRMRNHVLSCPMANTSLDAMDGSLSWVDYHYVCWASLTNVPGWYPLAYDRTMSSHGNRGVYVLRVDGSVVWDSGAFELKRFAKTHSQHPIQLPEE